MELLQLMCFKTECTLLAMAIFIQAESPRDLH